MVQVKDSFFVSRWELTLQVGFVKKIVLVEMLRTVHFSVDYGNGTYSVLVVMPSINFFKRSIV